MNIVKDNSKFWTHLQ